MAAENGRSPVNSQYWEELDLAHIERLPYKSSDGWQINGFLVKPINFDPLKKYPMILGIHVAAKSN
jgi:dipeptidyl aminopeptidase/acylaminoacyl peptidase